MHTIHRLFIQLKDRPASPAGLGEIPATFRLHAEMLQVSGLCDRHNCNWPHPKTVFDGIGDLVGHHTLSCEQARSHTSHPSRSKLRGIEPTGNKTGPPRGGPGMAALYRWLRKSSTATWKRCAD